MEIDVVHYSVAIFTLQLLFIGARTYNVKAVANGNVAKAIASGVGVHIFWLLSITIGVVSMKEIMTDFKLEYLPIILFSILGGSIGTYIGMKQKKDNGKE